MPKCVNCSNKQSKLNRGRLCRACFNNINDVNKTNSLTCEDANTDDVVNEPSFNDRQIIDLIKENMTQEKKWNEERTQLLLSQIEFLKSEILVKNTLIESLIVEISSHNTDTTNIDGSSHFSMNNSMHDLHNDTSTPSCIEKRNNDLESSPEKSDHSETMSINSNSSNRQNSS